VSTPTCVRCGRPTADGFACHTCALGLAQALTVAAGHAEDAEAVLARQTRYGAGGRGGNDEPLPVDLTASVRLAAVDNTIDTWARVVLDETGQSLSPWRLAAGPLCPPTGTRCAHDSCETIRRRWPISSLGMAALWLAGQVEWLRKHPAAGEAFRELHDACAQLARLVDRPPDKELVGMCDCGKVLYAAYGKVVIQCPLVTCKLVWDVADSRDILRRHLGDKLVTAAEAARLAAYLDTDRTQEQIRKLINAWASRRQVAAHGVDRDGEPTFRFGDVAQRLATTPKREQRARESAEMGA
jgi:hypothetical protein